MAASWPAVLQPAQGGIVAWKIAGSSAGLLLAAGVLAILRETLGGRGRDLCGALSLACLLASGAFGRTMTTAALPTWEPLISWGLWAPTVVALAVVAVWLVAVFVALVRYRPAAALPALVIGGALIVACLNNPSAAGEAAVFGGSLALAAGAVVYFGQGAFCEERHASLCL